MTDDTPDIPPVDPTWMLPDGPPIGPGSTHRTLTAPTFARLLAAAKKGGWPLVWTTWAEGEVVVERRPNPNHSDRIRPARRIGLLNILKKRPDLHRLLDEAAQERRDRIVSQAEDEIVKLALGKPDATVDYDKAGNIIRRRVDARNKLRALEQVLKAEDRSKWGDQKRVEVDGQVAHAHAHAHLIGNAERGGYRVDPEALSTLPPDEQQQLFLLLEKVESARLQLSRERIAQENQNRHALPGRNVIDNGDDSNE